MAGDVIPGDARRIPERFATDELDGLVVAARYGDVTGRRLETAVKVLGRKDPNAKEYVENALVGDDFGYYTDTTVTL